MRDLHPIIQLIKKVAAEESIDQTLLLAICNVESSMNPMAIRYEPHYKWTLAPRDWASRFNISAETEECLQKFSYGLAQVMGAVMRERGYDRPLQEALINPEISLKYSALHLKNFLRKYGIEADAIAAYNAGSARKTKGGLYVNQKYVDKVDQELRKLRTLI